MDENNIAAWVASTGAVGTAAFGIVETLKGTPLGTVGVRRVKMVLGKEFWSALEFVYGNGLDDLVRETFRKGADPLTEFLRTGLRISLSRTEAVACLESVVPVEVDEPGLGAAIAFLRGRARRAFTEADSARLRDAAADEEDDPGSREAKARAVMGRFEALMGARVDAAVCAAQRRFEAWMQFLAMFVALVGAVGAAAATGAPLQDGVLVGLAAVPVAPVTKDLVALLGHARGALFARRQQ